MFLSYNSFMDKNLEKFIGEDNLLKISKLSDKMQKKNYKTL